MCLAPVDRQQIHDAEADSLYNVALGAKRKHNRPLDLVDLMSALKKDKQLFLHTQFTQ